MSKIRVLFYCVGTEVDYLLRSTAVARKLKKFVRGNIAVLTDSSLCYFLEQEDVDYFYLKNMDGSETSCSDVRRALETLDPELIVTDTYPTGICGELMPFLTKPHIKKVFLNQYYSGAEGWAEEVDTLTSQYYDLVINIEQLPKLSHKTQLLCTPILIRDAYELHSRQTAKDLLFSRNGKKVLLAVTRGNKEDSIRFLNILKEVCMYMDTGDFDLRFASAYAFYDSEGFWQHVKYFPLFSLFRGVDFLVGMGDPGYELYYESVQTQIPTVFVGDSQQRRGYALAQNQISVSGQNVREVEKAICDGLEKARAFEGMNDEFYNASEEVAIHLSKLLFSDRNLSIEDYLDNFNHFLF